MKPVTLKEYVKQKMDSDPEFKKEFKRLVNQSLAYYDTLKSGLVPCKVVWIENGTITIVITANRGKWKKGDITDSVSRYIVPRKSVFVRNGQYRIRNNYKWVNDDDGHPKYVIEGEK